MGGGRGVEPGGAPAGRAEAGEVWTDSTTEGGAGSILSSQPLFQGLEADALDEIEKLGDVIELEGGGDLDLVDGQMFVVEGGSIEVSIGFGPAVTAGRGTVLNVAGMLGLSRSLGTSSQLDLSASGNCGQQQAYEAISHAASLEQLSKWKVAAFGQSQSPCFDEVACMNRLCPEAYLQSAGQAPVRPTANAAIASRSQCLTVRAAPQTGSAGSTSTSAQIRCISLRLIEETLSRQAICNTTAEEPPGSPSGPTGLAHFQSKRRELLEKAQAIASCALFPDAPAELVWALAELSHMSSVHPGQKVVSEGEAGESLVVVAQGEATVEKVVSDASKAMGRLGPGAVIGELCLMGVNVPRAATAVAGTEVRALEVPAAAFLAVLGRFPGLGAQMVHRLTAATRQLQAGLPPRVEVLGAVRAFSACEPHFLGVLARECERRVSYCGNVIREGGSSDGALYVVQHGICSLEDAERGGLSEIPLGSCFGYRTPVGTFDASNGVVRAVTPIVVILKVAKTVMTAVLTRYPGEAKRLCHRDVVPTGSTLHQVIARIDIFSAAGRGFLEDVERAAGVMYYMPNQTLCVEGSVDEAHMICLRGGQCCLDRVGKSAICLQAGSTFGERAFLGVVRRRTATIRAVTVCVTVEISRADVLAILERHPKERKHFEQLAMQSMSATDGIRWPMLREASSQLSFMLNLYAERRVLPKGDLNVCTSFASESVVLLMHGQLVVADANGTELEHLTPGSCFNEQVLLSVPPVPGMHYVPRTSCEVQILRKAVWDQVIDSFPQEQEKVRQSIVKVMAAKAEQKLGFSPGSTGVLLASALFRTVSAGFAEAIRPYLQEQIYEPGQTIIEDGAEGSSMYILLEGEASAQSGGSTSPLVLSVGKAFGEAVLLGATKTYNCTVQPISHCIVHALRKCHWERTLEEHPAEWQLFERVLRKAESHGYGHLQQRLQQSPTFRAADSRFLTMALRHAIHTFFAPGEQISSNFHSSTFVLLAGVVTIKDKLGFILSEVKPGELFGEAECLSCVDEHAASIHAANHGLVHCIQLHQESLKAALSAFPTECRSLTERFAERQALHSSSVESRHLWLSTFVLPTLRGSMIFSHCRDEVIFNIAVGLSPSSYERGEIIAVAGVPANSMLFLLEGTADVVSREGRTVGGLTKGACIEEVVALGLFRAHTATLRATSPCSVLAVPARALAEVEGLGPGGEGAPQAWFQGLRESRRAQVAQALPISALPLGVGAEDVAARAVALQAEHLCLRAGEGLAPLPDSSPCGPHFLVLARGRATVETLGGLPVQNVARGAPLSEGLAAEHGALVRAVTACELYRVRQSDFRIAVGSDVRWLGDFLSLEKQAWEGLRARLKSAEGVCRVSQSPKRAVPGLHAEGPTPTLPGALLHSETMSSSMLRVPCAWTTEIRQQSAPTPKRHMHPAMTEPATCNAWDKHPTIRRSCSAGRLASVRQHREHMAGIKSILRLRRTRCE